MLALKPAFREAMPRVDFVMEEPKSISQMVPMKSHCVKHNDKDE